MILKVDLDVSNGIYGIKSINYYKDGLEGDVVYSMIQCFNISDVKTAFSKHEMPFMAPDGVIILFYDGSVIELDFYDEHKMRNIEKLISSIFKMKMLGTKWAEDNPDKYI